MPFLCRERIREYTVFSWLTKNTSLCHLEFLTLNFIMSLPLTHLFVHSVQEIENTPCTG